MRFVSFEGGARSTDGIPKEVGALPCRSIDIARMFRSSSSRPFAQRSDNRFSTTNADGFREFTYLNARKRSGSLGPKCERSHRQEIEMPAPRRHTLFAAL